MKYPKLRELREAIKALIKGPYTSRFPYEPHTPFERFRGKPEFSQDDCMGCSACTQVCPTGAVSYEDQTKSGRSKRILTLRWDVCIYCGQCQANCPTEKGIRLTQEFDLATCGKREDLKQVIEKEFAHCDCCGEPIVPKDQLGWVANRLGPLCFANSSLLVFYLRSLGLALKEKFLPKDKEIAGRASRIQVICPSCRREAVLKS